MSDLLWCLVPLAFVLVIGVPFWWWLSRTVA